MNFRAQGTLEYLIIIAVVVVIALAVSVVLLTQNENAILINEGLNQYPSTNVGGIVISDSVLSSTGDAVISLKNETGKDLTITQIIATSGGVDGNISLNCNGELRVGHEKNCLVLDVNKLCPCVGTQTVTCNYKIKYTYSTGLEEEKNYTIQNTCTSTAQTFTLNYTATEGGTISGTTIQKIILGENGTMVTAIAENNYKFIRWSDNVTTPTRTEYNVTQNKNIQAIFEPDIQVETPQILLFSPENNSTLESVNFIFKVIGSEEINNCKFIIDGEIKNTINSPTRDTNLVFQLIGDYSIGNHRVDINCTDSSENILNINSTFSNPYSTITTFNSCSQTFSTQNGYYILSNSVSTSGNCITINDENITIDGNNFLVTGGGTGSAVVVGNNVDAYNGTTIRNFKSINFETDITSNGLTQQEVGGNAGSIKIYNSSFNKVESNGGEMIFTPFSYEDYYYAGNGGNIFVKDSNISVILSIGGKITSGNIGADHYAGNGGDLNIINSIINDLNSVGGIASQGPIMGGYLYGGNGGIIDSRFSKVNSINSIGGDSINPGENYCFMFGGNSNHIYVDNYETQSINAIGGNSYTTAAVASGGNGGIIELFSCTDPMPNFNYVGGTGKNENGAEGELIIPESC